jgi:hypothetical protein
MKCGLKEARSMIATRGTRAALETDCPLAFAAVEDFGAAHLNEPRPKIGRYPIAQPLFHCYFEGLEQCILGLIEMAQLLAQSLCATAGKELGKTYFLPMEENIFTYSAFRVSLA